MQNSEQYITYNDYRSMGGTLDKTPFNILEFKARKKIDERTQGRLIGIEENLIPQEVKMCVFELMKVLQSYESYNSQNKAISSESTDGYSVTYGGINTNAKTVENEEIEDIIFTYLTNVRVNNVPVLYLGVC